MDKTADAPMEPATPAESGVPEVVVPDAPPDGYKKYCIVDLVKATNAAMKAATKAMGKDAPPEIEPPDAKAYDKGVFRGKLLPVLVTEIATLLAVASKIGGKQEGRYDIDLQEHLATTDGVDRLATLLELMAKDKVFLDGLKEAQKAGPMREGPGKEGSSAHEAGESPATEAAEGAAKPGEEAAESYM